MHVSIIGAAGMVGRKLSEAIARDGGIDGKPVGQLTLVDVIAPTPPEGFTGKVHASAGDISDPAVTRALIAERPDLIFHLAAIVSGEAELDFDKGYAINLDGTRYLLEAIRKESEKRHTSHALSSHHPLPYSARRSRKRSTTSFS